MAETVTGTRFFRWTRFALPAISFVYCGLRSAALISEGRNRLDRHRNGRVKPNGSDDVQPSSVTVIPLAFIGNPRRAILRRRRTVGCRGFSITGLKEGAGVCGGRGRLWRKYGNAG